MSVKISTVGWFDKTRAWLDRLQNNTFGDSLDKYGQMGVAALRANTPKETGLTAELWDYTITKAGDVTRIQWFNTNEVAGTPLVIMLQFGHGTGTGGYVEGRDFINPAMEPVFDAILDGVRKEVVR